MGGNILVHHPAREERIMQDIEKIGEATDSHFILRGRLVGTSEAWADCKCGWHTDGTTEEVTAAGERHMMESETKARKVAESYIRNCHLVGRASDPPLFEFGDNGEIVAVRLDGYLIEPLSPEEFERRKVAGIGSGNLMVES
jgi:hypothetical protein